jgi:glycosyltransferase involved in cell wall biosynthesis
MDAPSPAAAADPRVTVVIPMYNARAYVAQAIESALTQTYRSFEIVVVNDGSTDGSDAIVRDYARRYPNRVRVIDQNNAGLPSARNTALKAGRGDYYALLDADDVWHREHLQQAMQAFDADPDLGLVHANIRRVDAHGAGLGVPARRWHRGLDPYRALALREEHIACPTAVFSREAIRAVGGFDTQFTGLGCEDRDLWLRIAERFRLRYLDCVSADYRVHAGSMSRNRERMAQARQRLLCKLALSPRGAPLYAHGQAMIESDLGLELLDEGHWWPALCAQLRALAIRPQTALIWRRLLRTAYEAIARALSPRPLTTARQEHR